MGIPQNLQQKPQPLLPLQQLQHTWHKDRWLWRFCLVWLGACRRETEDRGDMRLGVRHRCSTVSSHGDSHRARQGEREGSPSGKHIHLHFNLLTVIGLIHSVN